jgi:uncharacterized protein (TIGR00730 family)
MRSVCLFCGSSAGVSPAYAATARRFGELAAQRGLTLVYGGGAQGTMAAAADGALAAGGRVIGIFPQSLVALEAAHRGLTELHLVASLAVRKQMMADLADAFAVLPGGLGTLDELSEIWTWRQLGLHHKPLGLLNSGGFFDHLLAFLAHVAAEGFVHAADLELVRVASDPESLLDGLAAAAGARHS